MKPCLARFHPRQGTPRLVSCFLLMGTTAAWGQAFVNSTHLFGSGTILPSGDVSASRTSGSSSSVLNRTGNYNTSGNPADASTAYYNSSASAGFGDLHMNLSAYAMSNFAGGEVAASASVHGEVTFNDRLVFSNPLLPNGSDVQITLSLSVIEQLTSSASAPSFADNGGQADVSVTLSINGPSGSLGNVQFSDSTVASPVYQYTKAPSESGFGSSITLTLQTGVQYQIAGVMDGSASAGAHALEGHSPTETASAALDAGHTALFNVVPQTAGTTFAASSGGTYDTVAPEPQEWTLMAGAGLVGWAGWRRWRRTTGAR